MGLKPPFQNILRFKEITQLVKCLPKGLSLIPSTHMKKPSVTAGTITINTANVNATTVTTDLRGNTNATPIS